MKKGISLLLLAVLPLTATYAQSEKDSTLNRMVVVENEYNPHLSGASKINVLPKVDEPSVAKKDVTYATDLRPVSAWTYDNMSPINREWTADPAKRGYLRAGYGTLNNVDIKSGYIADFGNKDRLNMNLSLDGWDGTLDNRYVKDWKSRFYRTDIGLDYSHDFSKVLLDVGGSFASQVFNYMTTPEWEGSDKQHYTLGGFHIGISSNDPSRSVQYRTQATMKVFDIKYPLGTWEDRRDDGGSELLFQGIGEVWKQISDNRRFGVQVNWNTLAYSGKIILDTYTLFGVNPYYSLANEKVRLRIGAHLDFNADPSLPDGEEKEESSFHFAPDVKLEYVFAKDYVFYLQAMGGKQVNDLHRLNTLSPYWDMNAPLALTYVPLDASIGLKASPADGVWFNLFGGYRICEEDLSAALSSQNGMYYTSFAQDKTKTAYAGAELKYEYKDVFKASLDATYYNWKTDYQPEEAFLLSKPELELNFFAEYKVLDPLKVNVGYEFVKRPNAMVEDDINPNLENVSNLSIGASYTLLKDVSVFARINNLLNSEYYLASGYPAQKLSVLAGVAVQF